MMGNPGLLQEPPDISALLLQGGGDAEQPIPTFSPLAGMTASADFSLITNWRRAHSAPLLVGSIPPGLQQAPLAKDSGMGARRVLLAVTGLLHPDD
jgi:hypothetical protein